jgi:hypothetical protein
MVTGARGPSEDRLAKIVVNNVSYNSVDEMPADVRQAYESAMGVLADKNGNGIPDILEGGMQPGVVNVRLKPSVNTQFVVDGKVYSSVEALPPEARQKYERAMAKAAQVMGDANRNGVPDILEGILSAGSVSGVAVNPAPGVQMDNQLPGSTPPIIADPARKSGWGWLPIVNIAVLVLLLALIAFGVLMVLPRLR